MHDWPDTIKYCKTEAKSHFNHRTDMTLFHDIILKGERVVTPAQLRTNILEKNHTGHQGQEKCKRWTGESVVFFCQE